MLLWRTHSCLDLPEFNRDTTIIFNWVYALEENFEGNALFWELPHTHIVGRGVDGFTPYDLCCSEENLGEANTYIAAEPAVYSCSITPLFDFYNLDHYIKWSNDYINVIFCLLYSPLNIWLPRLLPSNTGVANWLDPCHIFMTSTVLFVTLDITNLQRILTTDGHHEEIFESCQTQNVWLKVAQVFQ